MILNINPETAGILLELVNAWAEELLERIPKQRGLTKRLTIIELQWIGVAKHRLEWGLGYEDVFPGPAAWGYPRT